jgi:hypothetical protein
MILEDPSLQPFEPILRRLYELAHRSGFSMLEMERYTQADFENNPSVRRRFLRACHYGYDLAQRQTSKHVIAIEEEVARLTADLKELRRKRDPEAKNVLHRIQVYKNRQITLRRLIDSILFTIIRQQNWLMRRFTVDLTIHNIDPVVIDRTVQVAVERNREDRMKFNLVSDLSTVVQIGDLIEIDLTSRGPRRWKVIELKQGKINEVLSGLIEQDKLAVESEKIDMVKKTMGDKAAKQAQRMIRQVRRMGELERIVETDRGLEPLSEVETLMTPDIVSLDDYCNQLEKVYKRAKQKGSAAMEISGCLRIVAISKNKTKGPGTSTAAHQFFHMANPERSCALSSEGAAATEEEARLVRNVPYFVDVVDYNLNVPIADPIFARPNTEMVFDLVMGRVQMFVQHDYEAFFRFAQSQGIKIRWIKGKEADEIKKFSMRLPATDDAWGVLAELPDGQRMTLLAGFLARPYSNFVTPQQMIQLIKDWPQQDAKTDPDKKLESPI